MRKKWAARRRRIDWFAFPLWRKRGSCACAAASAAYRLGLADPHMYVHMPGGTLEVEIKEDGMVYMVGEVGYVGHIQLGNELSEQLRIK